MLYQYCRKQLKNIKNSPFIEQKVVIYFYPSLCLLKLELPSPSSTAEQPSEAGQPLQGMEFH